MNAETLHAAISEVCPIISVRLVEFNVRSSWSYEPTAEATPEEIAAADNVLATIPITVLAKIPTSEFISRWTNTEYIALQRFRTLGSGRLAKEWDVAVSDGIIDLNSKKAKALKLLLVLDHVLTHARADEIFK
jgi:hypothetical protein